MSKSPRKKPIGGSGTAPILDVGLWEAVYRFFAKDTHDEGEEVAPSSETFVLARSLLSFLECVHCVAPNRVSVGVNGEVIAEWYLIGMYMELRVCAEAADKVHWAVSRS